MLPLPSKHRPNSLDRFSLARLSGKLLAAYFRQLLVSDSQLWILGLISASIFVVSVLGSIIGKRFLSRMRPSGLYFLAFALIFVMQLGIVHKLHE